MATPYEPPEELQALLGCQIVVDTDSSFIYVGLLRGVGSDYLCLEKVDVHDTAGSRGTKEQYAHELRKVGVRSNRNLTYVRVARIVSISKLDDVITF